MTDLHKTQLFRVPVFLILFAVTVILIGIDDVLISRLHETLGFSKKDNSIEAIVFLGLLWNWLWSWVSTRVWIGTGAQAHDGKE